MLARKLPILAALPVFVLLSAGCTNTEGKFNDFGDRYNALQEGGTGGTDGGGSEVTPCDPPAAGDLDAQYLFALSASANPKLPVLFLADLKSVAYSGTAGATVGLDMTLQSLDAKDRKTVVGAPITIPTLALFPDGQIDDKQLPDIAVDGQANPIQVGLNIVASAALHGQFCGVQDFYCGEVTGDVTKPIPIPLAGSTYTFELISDPNNLPDPPLINCAKDPADPPPTG